MSDVRSIKHRVDYFLDLHPPVADRSILQHTNEQLVKHELEPMDIEELSHYSLHALSSAVGDLYGPPSPTPSTLMLQPLVTGLVST